MVRARICCVCFKQSPKVIVFKFPRDNNMRKIWHAICGVKEGLKHYFLCSEHFTKESFQICGSRLLLKPSAYPTLLVPHRVKIENEDDDNGDNEKVDLEMTKESTPSDNDNGEILDEKSSDIVMGEGIEYNETNFNEEKTQILKSRILEEHDYVNEVGTPDFSTLHLTRTCINLYKAKITMLTKNNKALEQKLIRMDKKMQTLEDLVKDLQRNNKISKTVAEQLLVRLNNC